MLILSLPRPKTEQALTLLVGDMGWDFRAHQGFAVRSGLALERLGGPDDGGPVSLPPCLLVSVWRWWTVTPALIQHIHRLTAWAQ